MGLSVSWAIASAAAVGSSHLRGNTPCQDAYLVETLPMVLGEPALMAFVADGAGSASMAEQAAQAAVSTAAEHCRQHANTIGASFDAAFISQLVRSARAAMVSLADNAGLPVREFACTLLGVLAFRDQTLAFQIGDGGIVLDHGDGLALAITPMSGEYVNMTHFLIDDDAETRVAVQTSARVERMALFSDGLQRLALSLHDLTPHAPFFAPFFQTLGKVPSPKREQLDQALEQFLSSDKVNARTDDDKTLILACRVA